MTTKLGLTDLANGQANFLNANASFAQLNQLVQAGVVDRDLTAPPGSPADEALYIVASGNWGTGSSKAGQLAYWLNSTGVWQFITPREGMLVHVNDEDLYYKYTGTAWQVFATGAGGTTQAVAVGSGTLALASVTADTILTALDQNVSTITLPAGQAGVRKDLLIKFTQDATGGRTVTGWPSVTWEGGSAPVVASAANAVTMIVLSNFGDGSGWMGFVDQGYRPSNILGTVSQSAGVPTGAIIEQGSNANGNYVRYADGTQICWRTFAVQTIAASSAGSVISWTFPAAFTAVPVSNATAGLSFSLSVDPAIAVQDTSAASTATATRFVARNLSTSSRDIIITAIAVGRWF